MIETIHTSELRIGRFTSSEIFRLMSTGKRPMTEAELSARPKSGKGSKSTMVEDGPGEAFYNYIKEKRYERKLGRPLKDEVSARPLTWGKIAEKAAFLTLGFNYHLTSRSTIIHPKYDCWAGTPDGESEISVLEIKSPFTHLSFCTLHDCNSIDEVREKHKDGEKFYWQCVSNSILTNKSTADLAFYMPYRSELDTIRELCQEYEGNANDVAWIHFGSDDDLPHLIEGKEYKNIKTISFEIPEADKRRLEHRIELASKILNS